MWSNLRYLIIDTVRSIIVGNNLVIKFIMSIQHSQCEEKKGANFCIIKLVSGEPCILLLQRDGNVKSNPLQWCFPGGGIEEEDQTLAHTASREAMEEFGLSIAVDKWHRLGDRSPNSQGEVAGDYFATFVGEDARVVLDEGMAYQWHPINNLHRLGLGFGQSEFLTPLLQEFVTTHSEIDRPNPKGELSRFY